MQPSQFRDIPAIVAIPVKDEVERIADCLLALSGGDGPAPGVVLLVNNTTDATMQVVADLQPSLRSPVLAIEHRFPLHEADAGHARSLAMAHADRLAVEGTPLLTTDADGRVASDWLAANLYHLRQGIDSVFGRAVIDPVEAARIPPALHEADARECEYAAALDEIAALLDPDPDDPWPRHAEHSGASIAISRDAYRAAGGMRPVALGEDRAFHAALRRIGATIRHAPEVQVVVSGRILGRAVGGMADTIRRRLVTPDLMLDESLEPVADRVRRVRARAALRRGFAGGAIGTVPRLFAHLLHQASFAEASERIDEIMPPRRVPVAALPSMIADARRFLDEARPHVVPVYGST